MDLYDFLEKVQDLSIEWLKNVISEILDENKENIFSMLEDQWSQGENEDGQAVGFYKPVTQNFYAFLNPPSSGMPKKAGDPYNLMWDGNLFKQLYLEFEKEGNEPKIYLLIDSDSSSKSKLFRNIRNENLVSDPESIFGIQKINLEEINTRVNEELIEKFYKFIN